MSSETVTTSLARAWRRVPFRRALAVYVVIRVATLVAVAVANIFTHNGLVNDLSIWDGQWFLEAIRHGWPSHLPTAGGLVVQNPTAFFPLFPLSIRSLADVTGISAAVVGIGLSAFTGACAVVAIGYLAREFTDDDRAQRAALLFAVAPGSFVFSLIYAEGTLITLVAIGLGALMRRRWLSAGLIGAVASAVSPVAVAFIASCAVVATVAIWRDREWRALLAPALAPFGLVVWMSYLWVHTGNLMAWRITEHDGWKSYPSLAYPAHILTKFIFNPLSPTITGHLLFFGTIVSIVGVTWMFREHQPLAVLTYGVSAVVLFAISEPVGLRPRFVMLAFPMIIAAATRFTGWRWRVILWGSAAMLVVMSVEELSSFAIFP